LQSEKKKTLKKRERRWTVRENEVRLYMSESDSLSFYNPTTIASSCIHDPPPPFPSFISLLIKKPY